MTDDKPRLPGQKNDPSGSYINREGVRVSKHGKKMGRPSKTAEEKQETRRARAQRKQDARIIDAAKRKASETRGEYFDRVHFDGDALAWLRSVYQNIEMPVAVRNDAAKAAIRFEIPALATTNVTTHIDLSSLTDEELDQLDNLRKAVAGAGGNRYGTDAEEVPPGKTN